MNVNPEYEWMREWCPLFGCLPTSSYPPSSPLGHCMSIIIEARKLWDVPFLGGIPASTLPTPTDISHHTKDLPYIGASEGYPKERVLTARTVFAAHMSICQHSLIDDPRKDWYEKGDGNFEEANTLASVWERAVEMARYSHAYGYINPDTPDYAILAILAISEVWNAATDIFYYKEPEDSKFVIKAIQEAKDLLAKALELKNDEAIKKMEPEAALGKKQINVLQNASKKGVESRKEIAKKFKEICQNEAKKILKNRKSIPSERGLTTTIIKSLGNIELPECYTDERFLTGLYLDNPNTTPREAKRKLLIHKFETIRKHIRPILQKTPQRAL